MQTIVSISCKYDHQKLNWCVDMWQFLGSFYEPFWCEADSLRGVCNILSLSCTQMQSVEKWLILSGLSVKYNGVSTQTVKQMFSCGTIPYKVKAKIEYNRICVCSHWQMHVSCWVICITQRNRCKLHNVKIFNLSEEFTHGVHRGLQRDRVGQSCGSLPDSCGVVRRSGVESQRQSQSSWRN